MTAENVSTRDKLHTVGFKIEKNADILMAGVCNPSHDSSAAAIKYLRRKTWFSQSSL
jgi:hypothetical protein